MCFNFIAAFFVGDTNGFVFVKISLCKLSPVTLRLLEQINYCHSTCIHTPHPIASVTLSPHEHQSVCRGESTCFNCNGEGLSLELYSPPFVDENSALTLFPNDDVMICSRRTSAAAIVFVDPPGNSSISGTLVLHIPLEQSLGTYNVFCHVSTANETNSTFSVIGRKNLLTYCRPY